MKKFTITTPKAVYKAQEESEGSSNWVVKMIFSEDVEATYYFKGFDDVAIAERIFNIERCNL